MYAMEGVVSTKSCVCGVDVSAKTLAVALGGLKEALEFSNCAAGHRALVGRLTKRGRTARVVVEATGIYSLDLALALHRAARVEVMVVNPRAARAFAVASSRRGKTDAIDARMLCEYASRMDFSPWTPPSREVLELRATTRHIQGLSHERVRAQNRLHAVRSTETSPQVVVDDLEAELETLKRRVEVLTASARELALSNTVLARRFELLVSIVGIGEATALRVLAELAVLPSDMTARQWVAHAGLDPRPHRSGSSVFKADRISKAGNRYLRTALFIPARTSAIHEPVVGAFKQELLDRGKKPLQANVAVMRKLLHAIWGMWRTDTLWDPTRFRPNHPEPEPPPEAPVRHRPQDPPTRPREAGQAAGAGAQRHGPLEAASVARSR